MGGRGSCRPSAKAPSVAPSSVGRDSVEPYLSQGSRHSRPTQLMAAQVAPDDAGSRPIPKNRVFGCFGVKLLVSSLFRRFWYVAKSFCDISKPFCDIPKSFCDVPKSFCYLPKPSWDIPELFCNFPKWFWDIATLAGDLPESFRDIPSPWGDIPKRSWVIAAGLGDVLKSLPALRRFSLRWRP